MLVGEWHGADKESCCLIIRWLDGFQVASCLSTTADAATDSS